MAVDQYTKCANKIQDIGLGCHEQSVYWALRRHGTGKGFDIYPKLETIQRLTQLSHGSVRKALRTLREAGVIDWKKGYKGYPNRYTILPENLWKYRPPVGLNNQDIGHQESNIGHVVNKYRPPVGHHSDCRKTTSENNGHHVAYKSGDEEEYSEPPSDILKKMDELLGRAFKEMPGK